MIASFIRDLTPDQVPGTVLRQAGRCLLDLAGVAIAGSRTAMSRIICDHAALDLGSGRSPVRLLADGRRSSPVGAAQAGAATIDSMDGHDGHNLTKGHAGAAVLPAALAFADAVPGTDALAGIPGDEFLTTLIIGYEIGTRAGIAQHATTAEYHASGSWNALACAAVGGRLLHLEPGQIEEALGIAEYHGPRSPMMRCIDDPTMVKDGSAWGAAVGVSAALLAARGFTGAPAAVTATDDVWDDLGIRWRILEQYFKPYPVCRWAQPAIEAALDLRIPPEDITATEVITFREATRLATREPVSTEQAQYSLPYTVALALVHGRVDPDLLDTRDPAVLRLSRIADLREDPELSARFPRERLARVRLTLSDGEVVESPLTTARGGPEDPLTDERLRSKALAYMNPVIGEERAEHLISLVDALPDAPGTTPLLDALLAPAPELQRESSAAAT